MALALERNRLFDETRRRSAELSALHELSLAVSSSLEPTQVLRMAAERIVQLLDAAAGGALALTHSDGLTFTLQDDAHLLPLVERVSDYLADIHLRRTISLVAKAEEQLEGRFTDDAVLHLALVFAIMANRIQGGNHLVVNNEILTSLQSTKMWPIAAYVANRLGRETNSTWKPADIAGVAMEMMAAPRNDTFPGELERESDFSALSERLMAPTSVYGPKYRAPSLIKRRVTYTRGNGS